MMTNHRNQPHRHVVISVNPLQKTASSTQQCSVQPKVPPHFRSVDGSHGT